jgi:hypothetical protein
VRTDDLPKRAPTRPTSLKKSTRSDPERGSHELDTYPPKTGIAEAMTYENRVQAATQENHTM